MGAFGEILKVHLAGPGRRRGRHDHGRRRHRFRLSAQFFYVFTAALSAWVFAFVSGLFPYLGTANVNNYAGPGFSSSLGSLGFGTNTMLLVEGQTAFFNYQSTSDDSEITFDVKPWTTIGYSDAMQRVHGKGEGTVEIPIAKTGLYRFRHSPALARSYGKTAYTVTWGAR